MFELRIQDVVVGVLLIFIYTMLYLEIREDLQLWRRAKRIWRCRNKRLRS